MTAATLIRRGAALAVLAICAAACGRAAGDVRRAQVTITLPSTTLVLSSVFVAQDLGLFEREDLDVRLVTVVGVGAVNAVAAGSADFTLGSGTTFLRAATQGQRFLAIANLIDRPLVELVAHRDIMSAGPSDSLSIRGRALKGRTVAVQGIGSIPHAWVRYVANAAKLDPERDLRITAMDPAAMPNALASGVIDAYATSPPYTTEAVLRGPGTMLASGLLDTQELLPFAYLLLYAKPDTCNNRPEVCRHVARAFAAAARVIAAQPDVVLRDVLRPRFSTMDPALLSAAWDRIRGAHVADIRVTPLVLEHSQQISLRAGLLQPADAISNYDGLYTDAFVK